MSKLKYIDIETNIGGAAKIPLSYYIEGPGLDKGPVVLINHPLTANAFFSGSEGWWNQIVGPRKVIDTNFFNVISFNIPGNGIDSYRWDSIDEIHTGHIAKLFLEGVKKIGISEIFAIIGGSIGGGISWEMVAIFPTICKHLIPIASDWKSTDWVIANTFIQKKILENSNDPIRDARMHAMLMYRSHESLKSRFKRTKKGKSNLFNIESWLIHHGQALKDRFTLRGYLTVNHLLGKIDILRNKQGFDSLMLPVSSQIHIISINSDLLFLANENKITYNRLKKLGKICSYFEINSIHGHDAFLIENMQIKTILSAIFNK